MSVILGVDPGVTGALAFVHNDKIVGIIDQSAWCNAHQPYVELRAMLKHLWKPGRVVIEQQHARATRDAHGKVVQGIASTWNYAEHYGILLGCLAAYDVPIHEVDPGVWKGSMHLDRDKRKSLELARETWPASKDTFKRIKDHGRAEAALLARYGIRFVPLLPELKRRVL